MTDEQRKQFIEEQIATFPDDCELGEFLRDMAKLQPCEDAISRKQALDAFGLSEKTRKYGGDHSGYDPMMLYEIQDVIEGLPSVNPQASNEDIHREREQAYMKGYEDASKRYRTEPCEDAISRTEAIRVASGYCHWSNIPKELAKLPSVNPIQCEDAISRQAVLDMIDNAQIITDGEFRGYCTEDIDINILPSVSTEKTGRWIFVDKAKEHAHCSECDYGNVDLFDGRPHNYCPNCGARNEVEE